MFTYDFVPVSENYLLIVGLKMESLDNWQSVFREEFNVLHLFNVTSLQKCD